MPTADTFVIPDFPGREAALALVHERIRARDVQRQSRREATAVLSRRRFTEMVDALRVRMACSARQTPEERGSAFAPLSEHDLVLLEGMMEWYEERGRLRTLHGSARTQELLDVLRINYITQRPVVSGAIFRDVGLEIFRRAMPSIPGFAPHWGQWSDEPPIASCIVAVLPWRAALFAGEVYRAAGCRTFWHIGARRNEETLATEIYHETAPPRDMRNCPPARNSPSHLPSHLICDPMLATGGTTMTVIERLRAAGIHECDIVVHSVVAAPEGVDLLLHTYPELRIVTCALDERLDRNGYIAGPGLGDFGDLAFGDIDEAYVEERWVKSGLLTREQATIILDRMRAAHG